MTAKSCLLGIVLQNCTLLKIFKVVMWTALWNSKEYIHEYELQVRKRNFTILVKELSVEAMEWNGYKELGILPKVREKFLSWEGSLFFLLMSRRKNNLWSEKETALKCFFFRKVFLILIFHIYPNNLSSDSDYKAYLLWWLVEFITL